MASVSSFNKITDITTNDNNIRIRRGKAIQNNICLSSTLACTTTTSLITTTTTNTYIEGLYCYHCCSFCCHYHHFSFRVGECF